MTPTASMPRRRSPSASARYEIFRLDALQAKYDVARLPFSLKILLENLLRNEDGESIRAQDIEALARWDAGAEPSNEIAFTPARVLMQDFTGVPAVVDLAAMRDAMRAMGGDPAKINPLVAGRARDRPLGAGRRVRLEPPRSSATPSSSSSATASATRSCAGARGRSRTSRWSRPTPGSSTRSTSSTWRGSCSSTTELGQAYPDTLVGTDSHTTMINGLGVLGWGVGGIEAEAAMLGQPMSMLIPQVIGFKLTGELAGGRDRDRPRADRHRDAARARRGREVRRVLRRGPREPAARRPRDDRQHVAGVRLDLRDLPDRRRDAALPASSRGGRRSRSSSSRRTPSEQGLWHDEDSEEPTFTDRLELDLATVVPSIAGPEAPAGPGLADRVQGRVPDGARGLPARRGCRGRGDRRRASRRATRSLRTSRTASGHEPSRRHRRRAGRRAAGRARRPGHARRRDRDRARPRPRRDRRDHELHEHLEPVGDARRGDPRAQRGPARADRQAVGQDLARARARRSSPSTSTAPA